MSMPLRHTVEEGDSVIGLSAEHGLYAVTIWDDPENADLSARRADMNVLLPGDVVFIPDLRPKTESRATDAKYRFRRKGIPATFRIQLFDCNAPRANQPYTLTVDGQQQSGQTDGQGIVSCFISPRASGGELVVGGPDDPPLKLALQFGHLDPINEISGAQHRLNNLGYICAPADGTMNDSTQQAIMTFQRYNGLPATGELDDATLAKLGQIHDDPYSYPQPSEAAAQ